MNKAIIIGLCMLLVGCKAFDITGNFTLDSDCFNLSYPPTEKFCNESNMDYKQGSLFDSGDEMKCIDDGKIHIYQVQAINTSFWIIGNKSYPMEWTC